MRIDSPPFDPGIDRATWMDPIGSLGSGGVGRAGGIATWPSPRPLRSIDTVRATWQVHPTVEIDGLEGVVRNASSPTVETPIIVDPWPRPSTFHVTQHQHQPVEETTRSNDGER